MPLNNAGAVPQVAVGNFTGDNGNARQIVTGFKCSLVIIVEDGTIDKGITLMVPNRTATWGAVNAQVIDTANQYIHASDGFVVSDVGANWCNVLNAVYNYWAFEE